MNKTRWEKTISRNGGKDSLIFVAAALPFVVVLISVLVLGVNSPYLDEFVNVRYFR